MTENKVSFGRWLWGGIKKIVPIRRWLFDPVTEGALGYLFIPAAALTYELHWGYLLLLIPGFILILHAFYRIKKI